MRNIFLVCYNKYKSDCETDIDDTDGVKWLKFSPRMFEVKLANRRESVAYVEDANIFVITEGDTARRLNFHTGESLFEGGSGLFVLGASHPRLRGDFLVINTSIRVMSRV